MNLPDSGLVERARKGEKGAFDELYRKYRTRVFNFVYRMVGNREVAEDLTQEAFVKAYISLPYYKEQNTFASWLYRIAANLAKNALRAASYRRGPSLDQEMFDGEGPRFGDMLSDLGSNPEEIAQSNELQEIIQRILKMLSIDHRMVLVLCDIQGVPYEEAARILNLHVGTVASRLNRARERFNGLLRKFYGLKEDLL